MMQMQHRIPVTHTYDEKIYHLAGYYPTEARALKSAKFYREYTDGVNARVVEREAFGHKVFAVYVYGRK